MSRAAEQRYQERMALGAPNGDTESRSLDEFCAAHLEVPGSTCGAEYEEVTVEQLLVSKVYDLWPAQSGTEMSVDGVVPGTTEVIVYLWCGPDDSESAWVSVWVVCDPDPDPETDYRDPYMLQISPPRETQYRDKR